MTIMNRPLTDEERAAYRAKCERVASSLYSLDHHFAPWEEATEKTREGYCYKAHMARVWWNGANAAEEVNQIRRRVLKNPS